MPAEKVEQVHRISSPAAATPCTDGARVYLHFGSFGVIACDFDGTEEIVVTGAVRLTSYDPATGQERWSTAGHSRVANASPTAAGGLLFASSWNVGADPTGRMELPPFSDLAAAQDRNADGALSKDEFPPGQLM